MYKEKKEKLNTLSKLYILEILKGKKCFYEFV